ncbi:MAG: hypothetical protein K1W22_03670 [Lachnospiraceae bacterium]
MYDDEKIERYSNAGRLRAWVPGRPARRQETKRNRAAQGRKAPLGVSVCGHLLLAPGIFRGGEGGGRRGQ